MRRVATPVNVSFVCAPWRTGCDKMMARLRVDRNKMQRAHRSEPAERAQTGAGAGPFVARVERASADLRSVSCLLADHGFARRPPRPMAQASDRVRRKDG